MDHPRRHAVARQPWQPRHCGSGMGFCWKRPNSGHHHRPNGQPDASGVREHWGFAHRRLHSPLPRVFGDQRPVHQPVYPGRPAQLGFRRRHLFQCGQPRPCVLHTRQLHRPPDRDHPPARCRGRHRLLLSGHPSPGHRGPRPARTGHRMRFHPLRRRQRVLLDHGGLCRCRLPVDRHGRQRKQPVLHRPRHGRNLPSLGPRALR